MAQGSWTVLIEHVKQHILCFSEKSRVVLKFLVKVAYFSIDLIFLSISVNACEWIFLLSWYFLKVTVVYEALASIAWWLWCSHILASYGKKMEHHRFWRIFLFFVRFVVVSVDLRLIVVSIAFSFSLVVVQPALYSLIRALNWKIVIKSTKHSWKWIFEPKNAFSSNSNKLRYKKNL